MTSFTKGAEAMREMAAKAIEEVELTYFGPDPNGIKNLRYLIAEHIRALPLPSQPEDSSARVGIESP